MVMETIQIRLSREILREIDFLISKGVYSSRSDAIRDAARILFWHKQVGILQDKNDSVRSIREIRERISKLPVDLDEINNL